MGGRFLLSDLMPKIDIGNEPVFFGAEFSDSVTLEKADGSATVETSGIYDRGALSEPDSSGYAPRPVIHPQVTCPTKYVKDFTEDDYLTHDGVKYIILDPLSDAAQTTFTLEEI